MYARNLPDLASRYLVRLIGSASLMLLDRTPSAACSTFKTFLKEWRRSYVSVFVKHSHRLVCVVLAVIAMAMMVFKIMSSSPRASGAMTNEAYVWQRSSSAAVSDAVVSAREKVGGLAPLGAEIAWRDAAAEVAWPELDFAALRSAGR